MTIHVPISVRDRLAMLAEARGTSIRALLQEFVESTLTPEEREARVEEAKRYVAEYFGVHVTEGDMVETQRKLSEAFAQQRAARRTVQAE
ncbi:hypothetical protein [Streptomyces gobiensis]|uniref:hypothetical protein n=1 Tax=Streptomyces gobiensis TaxID=2875706 RepID=UPI001E5CDD5F|nr:hypothetical protein [Streptomyces gobiensis]UGY91712.1 hypothetical protein test1122_08230 [Streptomyces gobiensis]